jgi:hypothetical protein
MKKLAIFSFALLMLTACGSKGSASDYDTVTAEPPPPPDGSPGLTNAGYAGNAIEDKSKDEKKNEETNIPTQSQLTPADNLAVEIKVPEKIKRTADINISVDDYKKARAAIEKIVRSGHAYIGSENEQNSTYSLSNTMVIRVVNKEFDSMVNSVSGIASHVNSKNIYTEDVTAEFIDITSRLKTKREVEKRYQEILSKASKVTDILEVEERIRVIQEEIEAKEGQLKYLNDQVNYSTINLSFHQDFEYQPEEEPGFLGRLGHAFGNGWKGFLAFLIGIVYIWPLWLILGVVAYFLVRFIKKQLKKK